MLRLLVGLAGFVMLLGVVAAGGLVWRLTRGPLDVTELVQALTAGRAPGLAFDRVTLALAGPDLRITVAGLRAQGVADGPTLANAAAALEAKQLLHFALRPRSLTTNGLHLQVNRAADGRFSVQGLPWSFALAEPSRAPGVPDAPEQAGDPYPRWLGALAAVSVHGASIGFTDAASQQHGAMSDLNVDLQRDPLGALAGQMRAVLSTGDVTAPLAIDASRASGDTRISVRAALGGVNPAVLARLAPALAPFAALDVPVAVTANLALGAGLDVQHATLHAESGPGRAFLPKKGGGTSPGDFASLALDADGNAHAMTLTRLRVVIAPAPSPPTTILVTGDAARDATHATAHGHLTLDRGKMADLRTIWPAGVAGNARNWLVENVPAGSVHDGTFTFTLDGGPDLEGLALTALTGTMQADDVTVYWLRPVPPIDLPHVLLTMVDADTLTLAAPAARQGTLLAKQVLMRIVGMSVKDQVSQIDGDITAPVADVFTLLQQPRLKLLSVHPLPIAGPTGQSATHLTVKLPLESKLSMDSVDIHAVSHLTDAAIPRLVGKPLEGGVFDLDVTTQGLTLNGTARVAGLPSALAVAMDFRNGLPGQVVQHVTMTTRADDKALGAAGLDTLGLLSGMVAAKLDYTEQRDGQAVLKANADLKDAVLTTPLGWSKPAGPAASIEAQAQLNHGRLAGLDGIRADAPGLSVRGSGETIEGAPSVLHVEQCVIGRTSLTGTLGFPAKPGDPLRVALSGPLLDVSGPLSSRTNFEPSTASTAPPGRPYQVDLRFDQVLLSENAESVGPVTVSARGDDRRIAQGRVTAGGAGQLDARIDPQGDQRHLTVEIGDLGVLLHRFGAGLFVDRGALNLAGEFDDRRPGSPLTATATVARFGIHGAPILGKVLQAMTLYGLVDALRGPGLVFDELTLPFTLQGAVLELGEARAFSTSLGITAQGRIDLRRKLIDLNGTIVPAYFFNALLGRVPLIGRFFSPEAGGGVFAATFVMHGPAADPVVSVNPLATLTPGALRGLFGLFD